MTVVDFRTDAAMANELWTRYEMPRYESHFGGLKSQYGYLPLKSMSIEGQIIGLVYRLRLTQRFYGLPDAPVEATYTFPMPAQAGVSRFIMTTQTRKVVGELKERGQARQEYKAAIAQGKQAAITEQERPDVFTMTVGNIPAGEWVEVSLDLEGPLEWCDNEAMFRFPLVVGERYTPGNRFLQGQVGTGVAADTTQVRDASRVSPPRILAGYPNPVELSIDISIEQVQDSWWKNLATPQSSLADLLFTRQSNGYRMVLPDTANRIDRDLIVRIPMQADDINTALICDSDGDTHTMLLNLLPPSGLTPARQGSRQIIVLLDRSGSMQGWKQTAACRAVSHLIASLEDDDKFNVLAFDDRVDQVIQGETLARSTALSRYRAHHAIAKVDSRGGTVMLAPLTKAVEILRNCSNPYLIMITDGEVTNEKNILDWMKSNSGVLKVYTVGVGTAVNASFLQALSDRNGGTFTQVESEQSLNKCLRDIRKLIEPPVLQNVHFERNQTENLSGNAYCGWEVMEHESVDLFAGSCRTLYAQGVGTLPASINVIAEDRNGTKLVRSVPVVQRTSCGIVTKLWARQRVLELEYGYSVGYPEPEYQPAYITAHSLKYGVLSRFTAFLAVDHQSHVAGHSDSVSVTQAVSSSPTGQASSYASSANSSNDPFASSPAPFGSNDLFGSSGDPFASAGDPFSAAADPFGGSDPFGGGEAFACPDQSFAASSDPFGAPSDPFSAEPDPFGVSGDPFAPVSSAPPGDPFASAAPIFTDPNSSSDPFGTGAAPSTRSEWEPVSPTPAAHSKGNDWVPLKPNLRSSYLFANKHVQQSLSEVDRANCLEALIEAICGLQMHIAIALSDRPAGSTEMEHQLLNKLRDLLVLVSKRGDALTLGELSRIRKEIVSLFESPQPAPTAKKSASPARDEVFWQ